MSCTLHIFNPDTDFALALEQGLYTPPKHVRELRKRMCLLPALYSEPGDMILVLDTDADIPSGEPGLIIAAEERGVRIVLPTQVAQLFDGPEAPARIAPWGWNPTLVHELRSLGVPEALLPSPRLLGDLRSLAHRSTAARMQQLINLRLGDTLGTEGTEARSVDEALKFIAMHGDAYLKMPWSSSGRGVIHYAETDPGIARQWMTGAIRRQGSVMVEKAFSRAGDFATEWIIKDGKATLLGLSMFGTTSGGRYTGNDDVPQEEIDNCLHRLAPAWGERVTDAQRQALETCVAPRYSGYAGIDMFVTGNGGLNPCVEVNLRMTMGIVNLFRKR